MIQPTVRLAQKPLDGRMARITVKGLHIVVHRGQVDSVLVEVPS